MADFGEVPHKLDVSIPNRDFGELQFILPLFLVIDVSRFQSLIGILVNCNARASALRSLWRCSVSIPNRDFGELQSTV